MPLDKKGASISRMREEIMTIKKQADIAFVLGVLTLAAVFVSHLALTDIYHGEADLSLEWNVLRVCFAAIVAFQVFALATFWRVIKKKNGGDANEA